MEIVNGIETRHVIGNSSILESEKQREVEEILDLLKKKKQTYSINKFVLEETIKSLKDFII